MSRREAVPEPEVERTQPGPTDLRSSFVRALEAEYRRRATAYQAGGLSPEEAHGRALEDAKDLGRQALDELRRRGLFPWPGAGA